MRKRAAARASVLNVALLIGVAAWTAAGCSSRAVPARVTPASTPAATATATSGPSVPSPTGVPPTVASPPPGTSASAPDLFSDETACQASSSAVTPLPDSAPVVVRWHLPKGNACLVTTGTDALGTRLRHDLAVSPPAPTASRNCAADQGARADLWIGGNPAAAIELGACWEMELPGGSMRMVTDAVRFDLRPIAPTVLQAWLR